ncbi:MAG: ELM1/GtrOC1 family putative glycosyltransferase, partial [bacterium]
LHHHRSTALVSPNATLLPVSNLRVLAWMDGRPGDESQVRGLAACVPIPATLHYATLPTPPPEALERRLGVWCLATKHLHMRPPAGLLEELLGDQWPGIAAFKPQLSLAAGSRPGLYSFILGRQEWCPTVQAMTHGLLKTAFTLNVVPAHDRVPASEQVVVTRTAPNPFLPPVAHAEAMTFFRSTGLPAEQPHWALLVGGLSKGQTLDAIDIPAFVIEVQNWLRDAAEHKVKVLISTSRRTPAELTSALTPVLTDHPLVAWWQDFARDGARTAGAFIGAATQIFMSPDSVSMTSEALWAGRGVTLLPFKRSPQSQPVIDSPKHRRFVENLLSDGQVRWYGPSWTPPLARTDLEFRHPDYLAIQSAIRGVLRDVIS